MTWDWTVIGTVVGGFSTLIYTGFTYALLRENRTLRKAGSEPKVVAHFQMHPAGNGALQLALSNVGSGPAMDVSYVFDFDPGDFENYDLLFKFAEKRPAMTMIGQNEKFVFLFAVGFHLFRPKDPNVSTQLKPFHVKVSWRSLGDNRSRSESYLLDVAAYAGLPGLAEKPPMVKIADELESIRKKLGQLAASEYAGLRSLDATNLEQSVRSVRPVGDGQK
jgi:hypothetical protein